MDERGNRRSKVVERDWREQPLCTNYYLANTTILQDKLFSASKISDLEKRVTIDGIKFNYLLIQKGLNYQNVLQL